MKTKTLKLTIEECRHILNLLRMDNETAIIDAEEDGDEFSKQRVINNNSITNKIYK